MKKKTKIIVYTISGIFLFLLLAFFYIGFIYEYSEFTFKFYVEETGEELNGEVYINNVSFGKTENGKITIPVENLSINSFEFKTIYGEDNFNFKYNFSQDFLKWEEYDFIVYEEQLKHQKIKLIFYDNKTYCKLNGEVYFKDKLVGKSEKGNFTLSKTDYDNFWNQEVKIKGLTDSCFGEDENLPFVEYWTVSDLDYYFENDELVKFSAEFNPRWPVYFEAIQEFVRPEETREYLSKYFNFKNNTEEDLDKIFGYSIRYVEDSRLFNKVEYWQTPRETLDRGQGDCEDWAITTLSMVREYNNSLECYGALWDTHLSVICFFKNKMTIYDQEHTIFSTYINNPDLTELERKANIRSARNNYFESYGLPPDERMLYALFNEKDLITFETEEDFIEWVLIHNNSSFFRKV